MSLNNRKKQFKTVLLLVLLALVTVTLAVITGRAIGMRLIGSRKVPVKVKTISEQYEALTEPESLADALQEDREKDSGEVKDENGLTQAPSTEEPVEPKALSPIETAPLSLQVQEKKLQQPVVITATAVPVTETKRYVLQVGSFQKEANAQSLSDELKEVGFAPYVQKVSVADSNLFSYKVYLGSKLTKDEAEDLKEELQALGYEAVLLPQQ